MYRESMSGTLGLFDHEVWWKVVDAFGLGEAWRQDLSQVGRQPVCELTSAKGTLSFIIDDGVAQMAVNLLPLFQNLVIKCGELGVIVVMRISGDEAIRSGWANERSNPMKRCAVAKGKLSNEIVVLKHFAPIPVSKEDVISVTGAGDSLAGVLCAGLVKDPSAFLDPGRLDKLMHHAQKGAVLSLRSEKAISPQIGDAEDVLR